VEDWNWETIFYGYYRFIFNHCDIIGMQSYRIRWKNAKWGLLRRSSSSKLIEVGTNRKPVCDFLWVINSNWHPISYRFGVIAVYCSNFGHCVFEPLFGGLMDNVRCSFWGHLEARSRLPISVDWTFFARCQGWVATSENRSKISDFTPTPSVWSKISGRRGRPHQSFLHGMLGQRMPYNVVADSFKTKTL